MLSRDSQPKLESLHNIWKTFLNHKEDTFRSAAFILCWKMISHLPQSMILNYSGKGLREPVDHATLFADIMLPYIRENLVPNKNAAKYEAFKLNLARHSQFLKFVFTSQLGRSHDFYQFNNQFTFFFDRMPDHLRILKYFDNYFNKHPKYNAGWMYAGYNLVLESSTHLENR